MTNKHVTHTIAEMKRMVVRATSVSSVNSHSSAGQGGEQKELKPFLTDGTNGGLHE